MVKEKIDAAHGGEGWEERDDFSKEKGKIWNDFGVNSECSKLRKVLLHRPGDEISAVKNPEEAHWDDLIDLKKAQDQHDKLVEVFKTSGVEVVYLEPSNPMPNHIFARDLFVMTKEGAILSRLASKVRAGEEVAVYQKLADQNIPIVRTISGEGIFEGPDLVFVDDETAFVATSIRSNKEGALQVKEVLEMQNISVIELQTTYGCGHLDGVMNIVDKDKVVLFPKRVSYTAYETFKEKGFTIIDLPDEDEANNNMAINMVAIEPGVVLIPKSCDNTRKELAKFGIQSIVVDVSELMKGGGALHCMTGILWRD